MSKSESDYRTRHVAAPGKKDDFRKIDPNQDGGLDSKAAVANRLAECRERMRSLQAALYAERKRAVLVCLQGMDGAGKDSVINNVFSAINPMGCRVTSFKAPTELERAHDFLWRHHQAAPEAGMVALFNRSHYEAVVVERVEKIIDVETCKARFVEINDFERMLSNAGTTVIKFYLHISKDEQLTRFKARLDDPLKLWKISAADFEQRSGMTIWLHMPTPSPTPAPRPHRGTSSRPIANGIAISSSVRSSPGRSKISPSHRLSQRPTSTNCANTSSTPNMPRRAEPRPAARFEAVVRIRFK